MDNYSTRNSKTRPLPKPNYYHSSTYGGINYRQNDYTFATRNSALLWHDHKPMPKVDKSKGKYCSIALAAGTLLVLVVVLAIGGLALYMGALRTESSSPLITFVFRAKVVRGDRFLVGLTDKARRYRMQFETMYQRSTLGPSLVACSVDRFGNDTRTIFFRCTLNRRKIPRQVVNVEKTLKDILLTDAINRKPVFPGVQFDAKTVSIERIDGEANQKTASPTNAPKETLKRIPSIRSTTPAGLKVSEQTKDDKTGIRGMFKISKTDADITEVHASSSRTPIATQPLPPSTASTITSKLKDTYVTSALFKLATRSTERISTIPIVSGSNLTTTERSLVDTLATNKPTTTEETPSSISPTSPLPNPYYFNPNVYNLEPWVPILHNTSIPSVIREPERAKPLNMSQVEDKSEMEPIYTSFTNQGLSWQSSDTEKLDPTQIQSHPLPVNKITDVTDPIETIYFTTPQTEVHEESPVHTLETQQINSELEDTTQETESYITLPHITNSHSSPRPTKEEIPANLPNIGHAEVVAVDDIPLIQSPKTPTIVTLLPVKSNSGVGRPIRPRPTRTNQTEVHRSDSGIAWKMEVVTSISKEESRVRTHKNPLSDFHLISILNFATEIPENLTSSLLQQEESTIRQQILSPAQIAELAKISNVHVNSSNISQHNSFDKPIKVLNKVPNEATTQNMKESKDSKISTCSNFTIQCGDGQCLSNSTRCNNIVDCSDGTDEKDCTCTDYLRSQFHLTKICDGVVDCWDFSDENRCEWCKPGQYVCANSKTCINRTQVCDGQSDCPHRDDESQCVTIAPDVSSADGFTYNSEGYLMVRKSGRWGKLCMDNFTKAIWELSDLGQAVCKALTYQNLNSTMIIQESPLNEKSPYYELALHLNNETKEDLVFQSTPCTSKQVVTIKCQSLECGTRPQIGKKTNARIVGGGNAGLAAWPWQVGLYKEGEFQCGGTLISDRWLLSAGHCFYHQKHYWVARLGNLRRSTLFASPYEHHRSIVNIYLHPGYIDAGFINDISLLEMDSPVLFSDYVRPICLPQAGVAPASGRMCTIIGWGQLMEIGRIFPDTLQEVQVPIISSAECRKRTIFLPLYQITENMLCAGYDRGGRDACLGDSGGPLMCAEENGQWVLHGITSNGYGCARAFRPGVYTKVANYVHWIQMQMNSSGIAEDNATQKTCTGHRCPLGECLAEKQICNGYIECNDGSDEKDCFKV